jgi:hypothetical protein
MPEIGQQPVGNVDRRMRQTAQGEAQRDARLRSLQRRQAVAQPWFAQLQLI